MTQIQKTKLSNVKKIIMVVSGKGGVGKSTVAAGLALSLARDGHSVGLLDADIFGPSVPTLFKLNDSGRPESHEINGKTKMIPFERFGIKLMSIGFFFEQSQAVIWRGPMVTNVLKQLLNDTDWGDLDYLIIDTPPGTGDIHITLMQEFVIAGAIVVTTPQKVALDDVQRAIGMLQDVKIGLPVIGLIENMAWFSPKIHPEEKYFLFGKGGGEYLAKTYNIPLLAQIPMNETLADSCDKGRLQDIFADKNIEDAFSTLADKIMSQPKVFKFVNQK
jgi:ATP-binding protein involved in chromosome partitioning